MKVLKTTILFSIEVCYLYIVVGYLNITSSHINIQSIILSQYMCTLIFTHTYINILYSILCLYIVCPRNISLFNYVRFRYQRSRHV